MIDLIKNEYKCLSEINHFPNTLGKVKASLKASDLFIKCLEAEGVEYIFGIPGEETSDLMISLLDSKIKFILVRHEQGAAFMADMYGRLTQKVGVCLATLGPGATNLTTGVANANMDRSPILAITGQTDTDFLHKEAHQNMDAVTMFKPITKWRWSIRNADSIPEIVRRAFKIALEEKAGAVHLDSSRYCKNGLRNKTNKFATCIADRDHTSGLIKNAVHLILEAKRPIVLVGNGCIRGRASLFIRKFVEETRIFSMNTFMAKGVLSDGSQKHLHTIGIREADHALIAMKESDLVIAIGYDLVEYSPKNWNGELRKKIIHVDFTPAETDTYYSPSVEIAADIEYTMDAILEELRKIENGTIKNIERSRKQQVINPIILNGQSYFKKIKKEIVWRNTISTRMISPTL